MIEIDIITQKRAAKGDNAAFRKLYDHYVPFIWKTAYRTAGGNSDLAAEIVQETFINVNGSLKRFGGKAALSTWIYRIAYNAAMSLIGKVTPLRNIDIEETPLPAMERQAFDDRDIVRKILAAVSAEERFLLLGHVVEGLSFEDLEYATGIAAPTLRVRLHRIKTALQEQFRTMVEGDA